MGSPMVIYSMANPAWRAHQLSEIIGWADAGKISPHVSLSAPAEEFRGLAAAKLGGGVVGSCILTF
jgi:NADPH:quinone reductase-like Zn-dependent oxidoreductase